VLQYGFSIEDSAFEKRMELCKKINEDSSSEEDTGDDSEEDALEGEFLRSQINISSQLGASNRNECVAMPYGQGFWSIITPPPRM
jgi:hypothetical protein